MGNLLFMAPGRDVPMIQDVSSEATRGSPLRDTPMDDDNSSRPSTVPTPIQPVEPQGFELSDSYKPEPRVPAQLEVKEQQLALCPQMCKLRNHPAHKEGPAGMQLVIALRELRSVSE